MSACLHLKFAPGTHTHKSQIIIIHKPARGREIEREKRTNEDEEQGDDEKKSTK